MSVSQQDLCRGLVEEKERRACAAGLSGRSILIIEPSSFKVWACLSASSALQGASWQ